MEFIEAANLRAQQWTFHSVSLIGFDVMELEINTWSEVPENSDRIAEEAKEDESFKERAHVSALSNQY